MMVVARLRTAPLAAWQVACAAALALLLARLDWSGDARDIFWNAVVLHPLVLIASAAVLALWINVFGKWRRRHAYVRHDGVTLYRGGSARWPLALIRDVVEARGETGLHSLRLVVDDDSEVTRELVKLYMLEGPPEVARDGVMFAVARASGTMRPVTVH